MKLVLAPASFKESLSARDAAAAMARGARAAAPDVELDLVPVADGGEGTLDTLVFSASGATRTVTVEDALGAPRAARLGLLPDGTAVVEAAEAVGLASVPPALRNPAVASSFGVGQLILAALATDPRRILVGLGGSATNDAGAGALEALGARLLDARGQAVPRGGAGLAALDKLDLSTLDARLASVPLLVACDVVSPLCGPEGASRLFGPQKGASPAQVEELEAALARFARIAHRDTGRDVASVPGAGAAGGLGAALLLCGGRLVAGAELVLEAVGFDARLAGAAAILTGEGSLDAQTAHGKAIAAVAAHARAAGVPAFALAGRLAPGYEALLGLGLRGAVSIVPGPCALDVALREAAPNLERATRALTSLLQETTA